MSLIALAIFLGAINYCFNVPILGKVALIVLLIYYLVALAVPLVTGWLLRRPIKEAMRNPAAAMLWNARMTAAVDARILPKIMRQPLENISFVLLEMRAEKENFERRMSLTVGAIESVGLFPGVLATLLSLQQLPGYGSLWIRSLTYALPIIYVFAVYGRLYSMRIGRLLGILELAVTQKKISTTG
jgi:hypothetical protein